MHPPPQKLPLDVLGHIANILGAHRYTQECWYYTEALRQLSLVCKFMVPICQRHLFSTIMTPPLFKGSLWRNARSEFLLAHPTIATHYVKNLCLYDARRAKFSALEYDLLKRIRDASSLTSVCISTGDWNEFPEETKSVILSLIQIPTLRNFTLDKINNFPAAALSLCRGPTKLALYDIDKLTLPDANDAIRNPKITSLVSLNCSVDAILTVLLGSIDQNNVGAVNSIIALDRLRYASFKINTQSEVSKICKLLENATCLEKLWIRVLRREAWPMWIGSSLAGNTQPKLRHLTLNFSGNFKERDGELIMYDWLSCQFEKLSANNVLEVLNVHIKVNLDTRTGPRCDWTILAADLDETLTRTGAFPALRKVTVHMTWFILDRACAYLGCSPINLMEEDFPRLLGNTTIDFQFSEECDSY